MLPIHPLRRFHLSEYRNTDEYRHYLALRVGPRFVEFPEGTQNFGCNVNYVPMERLTLFAYTHQSNVVVRTPEEDHYRYQVCRAGEIDIRTNGHPIKLKPGKACMLTANARTDVRYSNNSEQLVLRTTAAALASKLQALMGKRPADAIAFDVESNVESGATTLRSLATSLIDELDAGGIANSIAAIELEDMVTTMFLLGMRHNYSAMLAAQPRSSAPFQVRLAEEYIEANWNRSVTMETLTEVTGVSARSLFERFQSYRGISPIAFLRRVRLQHARKMLMSPAPDTSVTGVALACGFLNTGHFARHYREAFGELPSKVLAASRSLIATLTGLVVSVTANGWFGVKSQVVEGFSL